MKSWLGIVRWIKVAMSFEKFNSNKKFINSGENDSSVEDPTGKLKFELGKIFDENKNTSERISEVVKRIDIFLGVIKKDTIDKNEINEIKNKLANCNDIDERKLFIEKITGICDYFLTLKQKYPKEYEEAQSKISNEKQGYIELNRLVTYKKEENSIILHHSTAKTLGPSRKLYLDAMEKLAQVVKSDPEIYKIEAVSWIINKTPTLFKQYGFKIEQTLKYKPSFGIPIINAKDLEGNQLGMAWISRDDFLKRFLLNKKEKIILEVFQINANQEISPSMLSNISNIEMDRTDIAMALVKLQKEGLIDPIFEMAQQDNGLKNEYVKNTSFKLTEKGKLWKNTK